MKKVFNKFSLLFLILSINSIIFSDELPEYGFRSPELKLLVEDFKRNSKFTINSILVHGASGTGKTEMIKQMAKMLNAELMDVSTPRLVYRYLNSGKENVIKIFQQAQEIAKEKPVIIYMPCIDIIGGVDTLIDGPYDLALQALCHQLERIKGNPNILFICEHYEDIYLTLKPRLIEQMDMCIYVKSLDEKERLKKLEQEFEERLTEQVGDQHTLITSKEQRELLLQKLAKLSEGLCFRGLEAIAHHACEYAVYETTPITEEQVFEELKEARKLIGGLSYVPKFERKERLRAKIEVLRYEQLQLQLEEAKKRKKLLEFLNECMYDTMEQADSDFETNFSECYLQTKRLGWLKMKDEYRRPKRQKP